jgi:hypothetical protein
MMAICRNNGCDLFDYDNHMSIANLLIVLQDRGPAGDFVFGTLANAPEEVKQERYREFMEFDAKCHDDNILFCKLLFIVDRDSVARTLGKRLAHKLICKDLHTWLDASSGHGGVSISREGLAEIDDHIDKTDFIAFNSYHDNLHKFVTFAKNTDARNSTTWFNPWLVSLLFLLQCRPNLISSYRSCRLPTETQLASSC